MDPPLVNESSFSAANPCAYTLAEIWPLGGEPDAGELGRRMGKVGHEFIEFANAAANRDGSLEESTVTEQSAGGGRARSNVARSLSKRKDVSLEDESSKIVSTSSTANDLNNSNSKRIKQAESREINGLKAELETIPAAENNSTEQFTRPPEPPKQDYIHVRARRGQATDSHSLAERARREKISERMRILQDLIPGCNKVIGKALVLDEIINYIQSLQRQVEFLSMKLEAVTSRMHISHAIEGFPSKDLGAPAFDASGLLFASQASRGYVQGPQPEWLHMQLGGSFERAT